MAAAVSPSTLSGEHIPAQPLLPRPPTRLPTLGEASLRRPTVPLGKGVAAARVVVVLRGVLAERAPTPGATRTGACLASVTAPP